MKILLALMAATLVSACSSSGSDAPAPAAPTPAPPPPTASVQFSDFVVSEIGNSSDTREPVDINGIEFEFVDNAEAYDGLFPTGE